MDSEQHIGKDLTFTESHYHPADFNVGSNSFKQISYKDPTEFESGLNQQMLHLKPLSNYLIRCRNIGDKRKDYIGKFIDKIPLGGVRRIYLFLMLYERNPRSSDDDDYNEWIPFKDDNLDLQKADRSIVDVYLQKIFRETGRSLDKINYSNFIFIDNKYFRPFDINDQGVRTYHIDKNDHNTIYSLGPYGDQISETVNPNKIPELVAMIDRLYIPVDISKKVNNRYTNKLRKIVEKNKTDTNENLESLPSDSIKMPDSEENIMQSKPPPLNIRRGLPSGVIGHIKGYLGDFSAGKKKTKRMRNKSKKRNKHNRSKKRNTYNKRKISK
jgi:hypothetical protein